ncbi:MAG: hypothetical protein IAE77_18620 [Prosthecobacter sp.]|jgi:hypothetical protein|uniref:hypothetical protein n=1 Tax=Prosthecobacter sp. TaxID=1965333 RepID=UPI001A034623|nr:hypothetical protein [Prosthecobacter sp.]MBE2285482.1 hypothetical protein [Prosthecobacter sp.]
MGQFEIIEFYLSLVRRAQERGICCAITSGMACVAYEVADATKDCDLLCDPDMDPAFLELLADSPLGDSPCQYRGNISPPLDARWHRGGWTSHFEWPGTEAYLDVFGIAPRARSPWQQEMQPPYAHPHVVADMKRTTRDKDWPFISALGVKLVESGDPRGWLHIYDEERMKDLRARHPDIPESFLKARPLLRLLLEDASALAPALRIERLFWEQLSKRRVKEYEHALRPYLVAVRRALVGKQLSLMEDHALRVACAEEHLPQRPLSASALDHMIAEAREEAVRWMNPGLERWLPDVIPNFSLLIPGLHSVP